MTASCSSPRPITLKASGDSVSNTRMETLRYASRWRRSRRLREVTYLPSRPAKGPSFTLNTIDIVGSSTWMRSSGIGCSGSARGSPIETSSIPASEVSSPGPASELSTFFRPSPAATFARFPRLVRPDRRPPGILASHLVHHHHGRKPERERPAEHEARLGKGPFRRVHQQQDAIHQPQASLHLAAEVGVTGGIDDVDLHAPVVDRRVLRQDGDPLLPLEIAGVHRPLLHLLVGPEGAGLAEEEVHQRRLSVVDVCDDGDVANLLAGKHAGLLYTCRMPQVHGHHHLALQVKDLSAAERFYVEALGLSVLRRWPWEDGRPGERSVWLSVGAGEEFLALESCDAERPPTPFRDPHGGLHLLALRIVAGERKAWEQRLASLGVEIVHRTRWSLYVRDPEGNRIGLSHFPHAG